MNGYGCPTMFIHQGLPGSIIVATKKPRKKLMMRGNLWWEKEKTQVMSSLFNSMTSKIYKTGFSRYSVQDMEKDQLYLFTKNTAKVYRLK